MLRPTILLLAALLVAPSTAVPARAQAVAPGQGPAALALQIRKLDGVKRVLMIGAHPDDEDTSVLAALARGSGVETAYLSLSRGEGGQNLIGPELHEGLGIIRTGELVAARALDGGTQYFTRAFDFGYSKNIDEALGHWPLESVLRDVVYVVREFRPHVIVSIFSGTEDDGHGQHQIAGVAAARAFEEAGDPARFPELAALGVEPWTPLKLYRGARFSPDDATTTVNTGQLDPVLGRSWYQVAMESRSQHRSQDMGVSQYMGPRESGLQLMGSRVDGPTPDPSVFAGIDTTFFGQFPTPLPAGWPRDTRDQIERYRHALRDAEDGLSLLEPHRAAPSLMEARAILAHLVESAPAGSARALVTRRMEQLSEAILSAAGVITDVRTARDVFTPGESMVVDVNVWNGSPWAATTVRPTLTLPDGWTATPTEEATVERSESPFFRAPVPDLAPDGRVASGSIARWSWEVHVPTDADLSQPYFLEEPRQGELYTWPQDDPSLWGRPFDPAPVQARVALDLARPDGSTDRIAVTRAGEYVGVDKAAGEYREWPLVVPALSLDVEPGRMVWPVGADTARSITVIVTNTSSTERSGTLRLDVPAGFQVGPESSDFTLEPSGSGTFAFAVTPSGPLAAGELTFDAVATDTDGRRYATGHDVIDYPHIRRTALFHPARVTVSAFPVVADTDLRVGYVMGSGDDGATALAQMGMNVDVLPEDVVREGDFSGYDVLVLGVRAYETRPDLVRANNEVLAFARQGGTVIVQYNKYEYPAGEFAPYPVDMSRPHGRVTDETADVRLLLPDAPLFRSPNTITPADFEGWVQERGLYFLSEWDDRFTAVMEMADPGEAPLRGSLLVAPVGDGLYVYTGLAFFRQFPAGVPGAYRLFANLVSLEAKEWASARTAS